MIDHDYWGRPEEMSMSRPSFAITAEEPGADLAGETAAALAASSIFLSEIYSLAFIITLWFLFVIFGEEPAAESACEPDSQ